MAITITDPKLIAELEAVRGFVEFRDPQGKLLSVMTTDLPGTPPPHILAQLKSRTAEELAARRNQPNGRLMAEVLAGLRARNACIT